MSQWEYTKRDLCHLPPRRDDVDLLNDCGRDGWELVVINDAGIAYLRRAVPVLPVEQPAAKPRARREAAEK